MGRPLRTDHPLYQSQMDYSRKGSGCYNETVAAAFNKLRVKRDPSPSELIGTRQGRFTICGVVRDGRYTYLKCECDCGRVVRIQKQYVLRGKQKCRKCSYADRARVVILRGVSMPIKEAAKMLGVGLPAIRRRIGRDSVVRVGPIHRAITEATKTKIRRLRRNGPSQRKVEAELTGVHPSSVSHIETQRQGQGK